jgi:cell division transport system permease protein
MALPRSLFFPAFRYQRLSWFFVALVGIMVYVATFATAAEATLSAMTLTWNIGAANKLTVEVPAVEDEATQSQAERIRQTLDILHAIPDVVSAISMPDEEAARLLKPWINQPEVLKAIALPTLIDVERKQGSSLSATTIQDKLKPVAEDIRVDDHASWLADMKHLVNGLAIMAGLMIILTAFTLIIAVSLVCRAIMATERETISLLHIIGAEDDVIAKNFQLHAQHLAVKAAWSGFALALVSVGILLFFLRRFADPSMLQPLHWAGLGLSVLIVPLAAIWMAALSARMSALKLLRAMP